MIVCCGNILLDVLCARCPLTHMSPKDKALHKCLAVLNLSSHVNVMRRSCEHPEQGTTDEDPASQHHLSGDRLGQCSSQLYRCQWSASWDDARCLGDVNVRETWPVTGRLKRLPTAIESTHVSVRC